MDASKQKELEEIKESLLGIKEELANYEIDTSLNEELEALLEMVLASEEDIKPDPPTAEELFNLFGDAFDKWLGDLDLRNTLESILEFREEEIDPSKIQVQSEALKIAEDLHNYIQSSGNTKLKVKRKFKKYSIQFYKVEIVFNPDYLENIMNWAQDEYPQNITENPNLIYLANPGVSTYDDDYNFKSFMVFSKRANIETNIQLRFHFTYVEKKK